MSIIRFVPRALALALLLAVTVLPAFDALSQQGPSSSVRPPPGAVVPAQPGGAAPSLAPQERGGAYDIEMWRKVRGGIQGQVSIPDRKAGTLVQSEGEAWRNWRNGPLARYGSWAMGGIVVLLGLFLLVRGRIRIDHGWSGRTITRFTDFERTAHWLMAVSFIILGLTGLNVLYGRYVLLPVVGKETFATLSMAGKWLHNYVAFAFMLGLLLSFVVWIRHNFPNRYDVVWLLKGGGLFMKGVHPPAKKFNAGQKILFWLVMLGGTSIALSGLALMFPFEMPLFAKTFAFLNKIGFALPTTLSPMEEMQYAALWHGAMGIFLVCVIIGHIYIGTVGMQGAFSAMGSGEVDVNWAKEHHSIWAEEELSQLGRTAEEHVKAESARPVPAE